MNKTPSFQSFYKEYKHKIYSFFSYRLNDEALVDDLTSETFLKAFEKFETYNDDYAFSTWIYTIARNTLTDHFRRTKGEKSLENLSENGIDFADENQQDIETALDAQLNFERVKEFLNKLPPLQQDCLLLKYVEGCNTQQISRITGKKPDYIRKSISRAVQSLQKYKAVFIFIFFTPFIIQVFI